MTIAFDQLCWQAIRNNQQYLLQQIRFGIEKESFRVTPNATIATTPHPYCLGSALTHPHITTDYSEALLEFITAPHTQVDTALNELHTLHQWTYHCLQENELLWPGSMPCRLQGESSIPIALYGTSNIGRMKHIYRQGLARRYGRTMQSIAGVHYNFSLPNSWWDTLHSLSLSKMSKREFISAGYIALLRNFRRYAWLLTYLFGASPAVDSSFFHEKKHALSMLAKDTAYLTDATCLRITGLGYKSQAQSSIQVCYNHYKTYIESLNKALHTEYAPYQKFGIKVKEEYRQLNSKLLQIENEYYSEVRPKHTPTQKDSPLQALAKYGVEYIEVRLLDVNPFLPLGIDKTQVHFLNTFLLHCLLIPSPILPPQECKMLNQNLYHTAERGRNPKLTISIFDNSYPLTTAAHRLLDDMQNTAQLLDDIYKNNCYSAALENQREKLDDINLLPSQKLLNILKNDSLSYSELMLACGLEHAKQFKHQLPHRELSQQQKLAQRSHQQQLKIENSDQLDFDHYLSRYFADRTIETVI